MHEEIASATARIWHVAGEQLRNTNLYCCYCLTDLLKAGTCTHKACRGYCRQVLL